MKKVVAVIMTATLILWTQSTLAAMTGGDFEISEDTFSMSDGSETSGGDYTLESASGEAAAGLSETGDYQLYAGLMPSDTATTSLSYSLDANNISLSFGSSPLTTVASSSLLLTVSTGSTSGYSANVTENTNLTDGTNDIDDVTDGEVTAGSEEYGISTTGTDGQLSSDTAIDGTVIIASASTSVSGRETRIYFEAAVSQSSLAGSYSHTVTFTVTANP